jgi:Epoxide hydrolase N terminus
MRAPEPYRIAVADAALADLRSRLARTRWLEPIPGEPWELGTDTATLERLVERWASAYDWRAQEAAMNELPHFRVELDGAPVHFIHLHGEDRTALPLILTHGWPGSFLELADWRPSSAVVGGAAGHTRLGAGTVSEDVHDVREQSARPRVDKASVGRERGVRLADRQLVADDVGADDAEYLPRLRLCPRGAEQAG